MIMSYNIDIQLMIVLMECVSLNIDSVKLSMCMITARSDNNRLWIEHVTVTITEIRIEHVTVTITEIQCDWCSGVMTRSTRPRAYTQ
jgi:hypothetical protein